MTISRSSQPKTVPLHKPSKNIEPPKVGAPVVHYKPKPTGGGTMKSMGAATRGGKFQGTF